MTTTVTIKGPEEIGYEHQAVVHSGQDGWSRCIGTAVDDPFREGGAKTAVRMLGAAIMQEIDRNADSRTASIAKTHVETAVMFAVKALYEVEQVRK